MRLHWKTGLTALLVIRSIVFGNSVMPSDFTCLLEPPAILSIVDHLAEWRRLRWADLDQVLTTTPRQVQCALQTQNSKVTACVVNESDLCPCDLAIDSCWHHNESGQRRKISDPACGTRGLQPQRDGRV